MYVCMYIYIYIYIYIYRYTHILHIKSHGAPSQECSVNSFVRDALRRGWHRLFLYQLILESTHQVLWTSKHTHNINQL